MILLSPLSRLSRDLAELLFVSLDQLHQRRRQALGGRVTHDDPIGHLKQYLGARIRLANGAGHPVGAHLLLAVRPEKLEVARMAPTTTQANCLAGEVIDLDYLGSHTVVKVRTDDGLTLTAARANRDLRLAAPFALGERVYLLWPAAAGVLLEQ